MCVFLTLVFFSFCFVCPFCLFSEERERERNGAKFCGWEGGEDLGRIAIGETLMRIYCIYFLQ